jgi:TatD DNase family protein
VIVDAHCHIDLYPDPYFVMQEARDRQVEVLSVTTTPSAYAHTAKLAEGSATVRTALGFHPELAGVRAHELAIFDRLVPSTAFVGEVGLDGSARFAKDRAAQVEVLQHVLRSCAKVGGRVLSLHSRGAAQRTIDAVGDLPSAGIPVFHWFSGTLRQLDAAIALGGWFSVGTPMLLSMKGRELVSRIPVDRLLTESDGPFTRSGNNAIHPWDVRGTVRALAELWELELPVAEGRVANNFEALVATANGLWVERSV